jgi:hypothetical protein
VTRLAKQFFVLIGVTTTIPKRFDLVYSDTDSRVPLALALLAQAAVTLADALSILHVGPSSLALDCVRALRCEGGDAVASAL